MTTFDEQFAAAVERMMNELGRLSNHGSVFLSHREGAGALRAALLDPEGEGIELAKAILYGPCHKCEGTEKMPAVHGEPWMPRCPGCKGHGQILAADLARDDIWRAAAPDAWNREPRNALAAAAKKLREEH